MALFVVLPAIFRAHYIHKSLKFTGLMRQSLDLELFQKRLDLRSAVESYKRRNCFYNVTEIAKFFFK